MKCFSTVVAIYKPLLHCFVTVTLKKCGDGLVQYIGAHVLLITLIFRPLFSLLGRLDETLKSEPTDCQTPSSQNPSLIAPVSPPSPVAPSETSDTFEHPHFSLAPQSKDQRDSSGGSLEYSVEDSENMADKKRRAPVPPSYHVNGTHGGGRELLNPAYVEPEPQLQTPRMSLPLPDYETLFPQKRHGVHGQTRWDHIIAEVNQKHRDDHIEFVGREMSVDRPVQDHEMPPYDRSSTPVLQYRTHTQAPKPVSTKSVAAPVPPKQVAPPQYKSVVETSQILSKNSSQTRSSIVGSDSLQKPVTADRTSGDFGSSRKVLHPSSTVQAPRPDSPMKMDRSPHGSPRISPTTLNREAPTVKPRQKPSSSDSVLISENRTQINVNINERKVPGIEFDPPVLSRDPKTQQFQEVDLFTDNNEKKPDKRGRTTDEPDNIFSSDKTSDPFVVSNGESSQPREYRSYTQSQPKSYHDREDSFTTTKFTNEPLPVVLEEPATGSLAGGKSPIRAWVSPSEVQPVSAQSSSGGLALSQRR